MNTFTGFHSRDLSSNIIIAAKSPLGEKADAKYPFLIEESRVYGIFWPFFMLVVSSGDRFTLSKLSTHVSIGWIIFDVSPFSMVDIALAKKIDLDISKLPREVLFKSFRYPPQPSILPRSLARLRT